MSRILSGLSGYKTYTASALGVIAAAVNIADFFYPGFSIPMEVKQSVAVVVGCLIAIFMRHGMTK